MVRPALTLITLILLSLTASTAMADGSPDHGLFAYAAVDLANTDTLGGHGIVLVSGRGELGNANYLAEFNTDTLRFRIDRIMSGHVEIGLQVRGELAVAGLLTDYFQGGVKLPEYGMNAGFAEAQFDIKSGRGYQYLHYRLTPRRWFFSKTDSTSNEFALPSDMWTVEQELGYTIWLIDPEPSWYQPQLSTLRRVQGFGIGGRLVTDWRGTRTHDWGAPNLGRNDPGKFVAYARQWLHAGWQYTPALRVQLRQESGWGWNEDDLTRQRIGGMNAYVVPVAGTPWASLLASRFASVRIEQRLKVFGDTEIGLLVDAAVVQDIERKNLRDTFGWAVGAGAFMDARLGAWNVDVQLGVAPDTGWLAVDGPIMSGYLGVGYALN